MLFVRRKDGTSHTSAEPIAAEDVTVNVMPLFPFFKTGAVTGIWFSLSGAGPWKGQEAKRLWKPPLVETSTSRRLFGQQPR